jgi:hypothetical protein
VVQTITIGFWTDHTNRAKGILGISDADADQVNVDEWRYRARVEAA